MKEESQIAVNVINNLKNNKNLLNILTALSKVVLGMEKIRVMWLLSMMMENSP